jgi:hypothetical protein
MKKKISKIIDNFKKEKVKIKRKKKEEIEELKVKVGEEDQLTIKTKIINKLVNKERKLINLDIMIKIQSI